MRLRILDKYVLKELLYPFMFGICAFSSIIIASTMLFKITQYMTEYGAPCSSVDKLFFYQLPEIVNYTFPMSMLLAALMAFGKLSGSSEIIAMRASGLSYYRILAPVLVVGFLVSLFSMVWAEKVVPPSRLQAAYVLNSEIKHSSKPRGTSHVVIKSVGGRNQSITYAKTFDEEKGLMTGITVEEFEDGNIARIQTAKRGIWDKGVWTIYDGNVFALNDQEGVTSHGTFSQQIIPLSYTPKQIAWEQMDAEQMTIAELREYSKILDQQHRSSANQWVEIWMRIAIPLASLLFVMVGAALGTQKQRTSSSVGLGIAIIVIFIYYAIMTFTTGLGRGGALPPFISCFIPNFICLFIGVHLMRQKNA